jgi:DNA-binding transcriptional ArsR family regulator
MAGQTLIRLGAGDWARTRFVRSPLFEATQAVRALLHSRKQLHQRNWLERVDVAAARARLPVLRALNPSFGWVPDFLTPPPGARAAGIDDEVDVVAGWPPAVVAAEMRRSLDSGPSRARQAVLRPLIAEPERALDLVVAELRWAWDSLLAPFWPAVHDLIDADIAHRAAAVTTAGLGPALDDLHPRISWTAEGVAVRIEVAPVLDLAGSGLALMPSVFAWPDVIITHEGGWPTTLIYPARGIGELWTAPPEPSRGLMRALGATRARLLADLGRPATTTALATRHSLSPASVSAQLTRLREAGLLVGRRAGKEVHYRRTPLADALVRARL